MLFLLKTGNEKTKNSDKLENNKTQIHAKQ